MKVIGAVAKPLLVNDEAEISEVIRRRLFENLGPEKTRKNVATRLRRLVLRAARATTARMDRRRYLDD